MKPTLPEYAAEVGISLTQKDGLWWAKDSSGVTIWAASVDNLTDERLKGLNDACFAYFMGAIEGRRIERERRWEKQA